ncbi:MAG: glycosyltransferase [Patescibacteria group bacterium]
MAKVAVIVTVLNEIEDIKFLINSLIKQTKEIVIVDGGSTDGTWEYLQKQKRIRAFQKISNRSVGRNFGMSKTKADIICFTDAGCIPKSNWLEELIKPFNKKHPSPGQRPERSENLGEGQGVRYGGVDVVSGYYKGLPHNVFEKCLVPYVLVMPDQIGSEFYPSTRSMAMRKGVGLFDEKLSHNEDYAFAVALKKKGVEFYFAPNAVVGWLPRKNLRQAAWMFLRFAIGDAQAGLLRSKVKLLFLRYYVFFFLVFINYRFVLLAIPYLIWSIFKNFKYVKDIRAIYWLPTLQITADIMVMFGTIVGLLSRIK